MIYCVEDERNIRELLIYTLETTGFKARGFGNGNELMKALKEEIPELILLDIMLPGDDGYTILEQLKSMPSVKDVPVIMVTARDAVMDKVAGLDAGADDYLTKPFAIEELFARIRVALKRSEAVRAASGVAGVGAGAGMAGVAGEKATAMPPASDMAQTPASPSPATLAVGSVVLDPDRREVTVAGSPIALTAREFDVLALLMAHAETVLTRERIAHENITHVISRFFFILY